MNAQLEMIPGSTRDLTLSQYFTPPELAKKVVEWALSARPRAAGLGRPMRVLEPSAGNGALVRPLVAAGAEVTAVEIDPRYMGDLTALKPHCVLQENFLAMEVWPSDRFDLCVQNPPYEDGQDVQFILHALRFAPRVVGIFQAAIEYGVDRVDDLWSQVRPTRMLKLKRRWFKSQDGKGGLTNYVALELVMRSRCDADDMCRPDNVTIEWW